MGATVGTQKARGAEILLEILRSEGIRFIFGNPGTTELPLIDALVVNPDFRYVWGLQEATAVGMADGYAQASGKPAFVNLHTSGGLGHGMGAIMNAKIARAPMVVTAGQQDLRHILADRLLAADLVGMADPVAKWCFEPNSLDDLPLILVWYRSFTPCGIRSRTPSSRIREAEEGNALARDHAPVLCIVGDGSAMYSPQALWSAVHEEVPVVFVILNNLEYGILKNFMLSQPQYSAKEHGFLAMDLCHPKYKAKMSNSYQPAD